MTYAKALAILREANPTFKASAGERQRIDEERARGEIQAAVEVYRQAEAAMRTTPRQRRDHIQRLLASVREARERWEASLASPALFAPFVDAYDDPAGAIHVEGEAREVVRHLRAQEVWLEGAARIAGDAVSLKGGRTRGEHSPIRPLIVALRDTYERIADRRATITRRDTGTAEGPLVDLVMAVIAEAGITRVSTSIPDQVADVLRSHDEAASKARRRPLIERFREGVEQ